MDNWRCRSISTIELLETKRKARINNSTTTPSSFQILSFYSTRKCRAFSCSLAGRLDKISLNCASTVPFFYLYRSCIALQHLQSSVINHHQMKYLHLLASQNHLHPLFEASCPSPSNWSWLTCNYHAMEPMLEHLHSHDP